MKNHITVKSLLLVTYLSLLMLILTACPMPSSGVMPTPNVTKTREARMAQLAATDAWPEEEATLIAEVATHEAKATGTAEAEETAASNEEQLVDELVSEEVAEQPSKEEASAEPALALKDVKIDVLSCSPYVFHGTPRPNEFVCDYNIRFSVEYNTGGNLACIICFAGDGGESDRKPVSQGKGTSEINLPIEGMIVRGGGETKHSAFCQLKDASSDEWLAEAYLGGSAYDSDLTMPVR
jgi:hypothetical protein